MVIFNSNNILKGGPKWPKICQIVKNVENHNFFKYIISVHGPLGYVTPKVPADEIHSRGHC